MNNQAQQVQPQHVHPHYTLPGIMHYLQTEFTKNERDRISWELEKFEMKSRIAQLEGENRDLRYKLSKLNVLNNNHKSTNDVENEKTLDEAQVFTNSRLAVQENVKEIIYLLKNTNIDVLNNVNIDSREKLHNLQSLNATSSVDQKMVANQELTPSFHELLSDSSIENIKLLKVSSDNSIIISGDNSIEKFNIDPNNFGKSNRMLYTGVSSNLIDVYAANNNIISLDDTNIKTWLVNHQDISSTYDLLSSDNTEIDLKLVRDVDFKNNWLLLTTNEKIHIWKILLPQEDKKNEITIETKQQIDKESENRTILSASYGITEKSIVVFYNNPFELIIYNFQGTILQKIDLSNSIDITSVKPDLSDVFIKLHLNKDSSKLLLQLDNLIVCYSFDQRQVVLRYTLPSIPDAISYKFIKDIIAISYQDGTMEVRKLSNFNNIIKEYKSKTAPSTTHHLLELFIVNNIPFLASATNNNKITLHKLPAAL
ncbi:hypothetical protein Kpol_197p2 [Vanderwaltozyma polyspora DSM 70294]|uniref:Striatin N-terminal domain-containing protein n=1 Tax=Vanderwaltozyma polyspora (strain ATCC 22028 / DSM 70294 / BCRC 21397 / CBS 2163 / NBRC 10782 / NRRL Y-8283 / UCD 57-17) TaxID=436907 RepID=A7TTJ3_VANPO|nr:uncharacterized protein Kpol_197p2 [Vanderwaltozyma polyspora DSM 70294]EDO14414.1 hypothetical protein Kpol_197p2 [Vanderwaltozyma polyspora DSM 70294]